MQALGQSVANYTPARTTGVAYNSISSTDTPVTVDASVIWQINGGLILGDGFVNNGDLTINN
jgi:hypothetical protein